MESWTLKRSSMLKLQAFEMWIFRRILKISWTDRITNDEVVIRMQQQPELLASIKRRKTSYFGHIVRNPKYDILKLIIQGKIDGIRGVGRPQMSWIDNIMKWTGLRTFQEVLRAAENRDMFKQIISNIDNNII